MVNEEPMRQLDLSIRGAKSNTHPHVRVLLQFSACVFEVVCNTFY